MKKHAGLFIMLIALCINSQEAFNPDSLFKEICFTVDSCFYDSNFNGVNWQTIKQEYRQKATSATSSPEFASIINDMLAKLKTSHTYYYTAEDPVYYQLADIFSTIPSFRQALSKAFTEGIIKYTDIGIITQQAGTDCFVKAVLDSSPANIAGILSGDRIISVDGKPFSPVSSFRDKAGKDVMIKIQRTENKDSVLLFRIKPEEYMPNIMFENAMKKSVRIISYKGKNICYVHVWSFAGEQYYETLKYIAASTSAYTQALVLDLRFGPGGANPDYLNIFNERVPAIKQQSRDGQVYIYDPQWKKPVILLVNEETRSGKELFAYGFKKYHYGKIVGTRTAGAALGAMPHFLSDGSMLYLAEIKCLVDGETIEGKGVTPDVEVKQEMRYCAGKDLQLEKALDIAAQEAKKKK
jgi:carboxyl-terminal processing protease